VACRVKGQGSYTELALGQGQHEAAIAALHSAAAAGGWLCIKNAHLAVAWLPEFHRKLATAAASAAPGFRLWMTSEPHELFPAALLSASLVCWPSPKLISYSWVVRFVSGTLSK
jgi:dynein heavy chain 2, cytosolic